jgi:hypothetical protein
MLMQIFFLYMELGALFAMAGAVMFRLMGSLAVPAPAYLGRDEFCG